MQKKEKETYYDVIIEAQVPATLKFRVYAKSPQDASTMVEQGRLNFTDIKYHISKRKQLKLLVFESGQLMLKYMKTLFK